MALAGWAVTGLVRIEELVPFRLHALSASPPIRNENNRPDCKATFTTTPRRCRIYYLANVAKCVEAKVP